MLLTDGKRTVKITMQVEKRGRLLPDFSEDFFEAGLLMRNSNTGAYYVDDLEYCIDQAFDWQFHRGDFLDDSDESRVVYYSDFEEEGWDLPYVPNL